jgi:hypothetical protein
LLFGYRKIVNDLVGGSFRLEKTFVLFCFCDLNTQTDIGFKFMLHVIETGHLKKKYYTWVPVISQVVGYLLNQVTKILAVQARILRIFFSTKPKPTARVW